MSGIRLHEAFVRAVTARLGDEAEAFLRACEEAPHRGMRMNPRKPLPPEARAVLTPGEPIPWADDAFELAADTAAGSHPLHEAGAFYMQEPSAMAPAEVLRAGPGERVLDLCAAPGGKTVRIADGMGGDGLLVCNEPVPDRARVLSRNLERMGVTNALAVSAWPDELARRWPETFDAVLVDAPCSGEGMFRRVPESRLEWTPDAPARCAKRQAEILDAAARMLRPGGRLVYATCTLNRTENEDTVDAFLCRHPDFGLRPWHLPGIDAPEGLWTAWPHRVQGEGQFCALLTRKGEAERPAWTKPALPAVPKETLRILRDTFPNAPLPTGMLGETLVCLDGMPDVTGLRVMRCGLHLGAAQGRVFRPDHAWALSNCPPDVPRFPVDEAGARRYQAGETLGCPESLTGWVLPTLWGLPLGWGKASGGQIKNHYPKGLRRPLH